MNSTAVFGLSALMSLIASSVAARLYGGLVLVASVAFLLGSVITDWGNSWKSLLLLAVSYPAYRLIIAARDRSAAS